jgi:hypothetical protein
MATFFLFEILYRQLNANDYGITFEQFALQT